MLLLLLINVVLTCHTCPFFCVIIASWPFCDRLDENVWCRQKSKRDETDVGEGEDDGVMEEGGIERR